MPEEHQILSNLHAVGFIIFLYISIVAALNGSN